MPSAHPNLERYLKDAAVSDWFRRAKRPDQWLLGLWSVIVVLAFLFNAWLWLIPIAPLIFGGAWVLTGLRIGSFNQGKIFSAMYVEDYLVRRVLRALRKGRLEAVGSEAVGILESCAGVARGPVEAFVEAKWLGKGAGVYLSVQSEAVRIMDALMRRALAVLQGPLMFRRPLGSDELETLRSIASQITELARESKEASRLIKEPGESEALRETLANLRAFRAAQEEVSSTIEQ